MSNKSQASNFFSMLILAWQYMLSKLKKKKNFKKKTLWPLFVHGVQLFQGYRATTSRQFTFYHSVPSRSWYSTDRHRKDKRSN